MESKSIHHSKVPINKFNSGFIATIRQFNVAPHFQSPLEISTFGVSLTSIKVRHPLKNICSTFSFTMQSVSCTSFSLSISLFLCFANWSRSRTYSNCSIQYPWQWQYCFHILGYIGFTIAQSGGGNSVQCTMHSNSLIWK